MTRKTTLNALGGYQPFLFCIGMYFVALIFSIMICSAIFHAIHPKNAIVRNDERRERTVEAGSVAGSTVLLTAVK
jgi:hypothetical protein